jgi:hypothetical protein
VGEAPETELELYTVPVSTVGYNNKLLPDPVKGEEAACHLGQTLNH